MFDIGWTELLLIGIVALIVVGPKDLPGMFRTLGRFTGKMKGMAREFQRAMNDAADEAGVKDLTKDLKNVTSARSMGLDKLSDAASKFEKWEPGKSDTKKGPETQKLAEERAATAKKIHDYSAAKGAERRAADAASKAETAPKTVEAGAETPVAAKPAPKPKAPAKPAPKPKAPAKPAKTAKPRVAMAKPAKAGDSAE